MKQLFHAADGTGAPMSPMTPAAAHASFFSYTGTDCDPDLHRPTSLDRRPTSPWVLAAVSACAGAVVGRLSIRRHP